jgi:hypothetical protein
VSSFSGEHYTAIYKAVGFGLLVFAFHLIEEAIKEVVHGHRVAAAFREMRIDDLLARTVIVFCTFIPLFAFRELQRVLGEDKFRTLLFRTNDGPKPDLSCRS